MYGNELKKLLDNSDLDLLYSIDNRAVIHDVDVINDSKKDILSYSSETIYLVKKDIPFVHHDQIAYVIADEGVLLSLFHEIHTLLNKEQAAEKTYIRLIKSMYAGESIQSFLNDYASGNGHFIAVLDISGRILANSEPVIDSSVWQTAVKNGFCDFDFMEHIRERSKMRRQGSSDMPSIYYCKSKALYYLSNRIHVDGRYVGNVFMIRHSDDFTEQDHNIISTICRVYSDIIRKEQQSNDINTYLYGGVLGDLLSGMSESQARSRLRTSGLTFAPNLRVLVLRSLQYFGDRYLRSTLLPKLQSYLPSFPYLMHREGLIIIADNDALKGPGLKEKFEEFCIEQHLLAGISDVFHDPVQFPEYFEQAHSVVLLAQKLNRDGSILMFRDYAFYLLIESVKDRHQLRGFAHPALSILRDYDQEKQSSLFDTLRTFISCGFSPSEAADSLFLHRNTFNYRKKKIEELCAINLEDNQTRFQLACSYQIFDYLDNSFE
jgi:hypothetical protein